MLVKLMEFGRFHPIKRKDSVQDIDLLVLGSRAQSVYSKTGDLLGKDAVKLVRNKKAPLREFKARDLDELIHTFEDDIETLGEVLAYTPTESERLEISDMLLSIREASLTVFNNLQKISVKYDLAGIVTIEGFIPSSSIDDFRQILDKYVFSVETLTKEESRSSSTPSLVVNRKVISIFEDLSLQRGIPKYNEIDPTPIVAFVFPLFFGIMFGDVGHGVTLLALSWYLFSKTKYIYWGKLLAVLGSSALVMGFVRGLFFGVEFPSPVERVIPLTRALSAGFTLQNIPLILELAIVIGTFHLATAYVISFVNEMRSRDYLEAFLDRMATLALYSSIIPFGLAVAGTDLQLGVLYTSTASTPFFNQLLGLQIPVSILAKDSLPFILGSLVVLAISKPVVAYQSSHKSKDLVRAIGSGVLQIVAKPFEFFTNVLSYVRLGVLMITTYVLGSLVAGVLAFGVLGGVIAIFLNIIVMSMEGLIVYIQDMRLQLYEWLSKFYIGTGTPFSPIISNGHFSRITWGEQPVVFSAVVPNSQF